ncbi:MAG: hypothetical protein A2W01_06625 [Candidatus Solincola sediminis]|uniref:Uncharacterized protein n=1 Tax=Candidatus Solincola sediminis TaxID=1797199 RepID=A0A1F2WEY9_9ACTN|nr:MAG: hypothetical protein A2Y75_09855 [Candidatus Solincola sediminis]OFW59128.1 MAG: hypothetical protein A2W01_06625 [Candidatus Solincola sediminis]
MPGRRTRIVLTMSLPCLLLLLLLFPFSLTQPVFAQTEGISVSASMVSYSYAPTDKAHLAIALQIPHSRETSLSLDLLLYSALSTRSQLASFQEGKRRYPMLTQQLEAIGTKTEWSDKEYIVNLDEFGLESGVYPFEVAVSQQGEKLASCYNFLVIMRASAGKPLNLSPLWSIDFLPAENAEGGTFDTGLAGACSSSSREPGFLYALTKTLKQSGPGTSNLLLPRATYEGIETLAERAEDADAGEAEKGADEIMHSLNEMLSSGQLGLMGTTYSFALPDSLVATGMESDIAPQMRLVLEEPGNLSKESSGFALPLFSLTDSAVQRMYEAGVDFTVVGEEALQASSAGSSLLEGATLCQPVNFTGSNGGSIKAFPLDAAIYHYLEGTTETDPSRLIQRVIADLAMLQREKPALRCCTLAFPPGFMPSQEFMEGFYNTLKGCSWLRVAPLSQLNGELQAIPGITVPAPSYEEPQSGYALRLDEIRSQSVAFANAIQLEKHPLKTQLQKATLVAENYRFVTERDMEAGQAYLDSIESLIRGETSKIKIEQKRSFMLSSTEGNLNIAISSSLDYPITANLKMENSSLSFDDQEGITIRPRENSFSFSVNTHRKGSFIVDIVLETGGLIIDRTTTSVNTSIINTMAVILLACLAGLVAGIILIRRLSRGPYKGKHAKSRGG